MEMTARGVITGVRRFKPEPGTEFEQWDSTKVYVQLEFGRSNEDGKGFATVEYHAGPSSEFDKFQHLPFPCLCNMVLEAETTGKGRSRTLIRGISPVETPKPTGSEGARKG